MFSCVDILGSMAIFSTFYWDAWKVERRTRVDYWINEEGNEGKCRYQGLVGEIWHILSQKNYGKDVLSILYFNLTIIDNWRCD